MHIWRQQSCAAYGYVLKEDAALGLVVALDVLHRLADRRDQALLPLLHGPNQPPQLCNGRPLPHYE